jgi:hypothetical protein
MPDPTPRRARWTLRITAGIFAAAVAFSLLTASATAPLLRGVVYAGAWLGSFGANVTGHEVLSEDMRAARSEAGPAFVRAFGDAQYALAAVGWQLGPPAEPRFECWAEGDDTVCGYFANVDGDAPVPLPMDQQVVAVDRLFSTTSGALTGSGWRCERPLLRVPDGAPHTTCALDDAVLELEAPAPSDAGGTSTYPRLRMELHVSQEAYRTGGDGTAV